MAHAQKYFTEPSRPLHPYPSSSYSSTQPESKGREHHSFMGDQGDDLRGPGDSDNNGSQKDGDRVGGHRRTSRMAFPRGSRT